MFKPEFKEILTRFSEEWKQTTKENYKQTGRIKSGNLLRSIDTKEYDRPKDGISLEMLYYGKFLDEGTKHIRPTPFILPSFNQVMEQYNETIGEDYAQQVEEYFAEKYVK